MKNTLLISLESLFALHEKLSTQKIKKQDFNTLFARLLFCFFAETVKIFPSEVLYKYINRSNRDGTDTADYLKKLFRALKTPLEFRKDSHIELNQFPHIESKLFEKEIQFSLLGTEFRSCVLLCIKNYSGLEMTKNVDIKECYELLNKYPNINLHSLIDSITFFQKHLTTYSKKIQKEGNVSCAENLMRLSMLNFFNLERLAIKANHKILLNKTQELLDNLEGKN